jgi:acetyltransferase-like isoleucine patch superfamily enzyme
MTLKNLIARLLGRRPDRRQRMAALINELRESGMKIGANVALYNCTLDTNFPFLIEIGANSIVTHATILAHDASATVFGHGVVTGRVSVGERCFVGAGALLLPGVSVGPGSIVGAHSVVTKDVPAGSVVAGNPARVVCSVDEWAARLSLPGRGRILVAADQAELVPTEVQSAELATRVHTAWTLQKSA